jgi:alkylation response protein AidB-like acyl-CoA dehydrogenase
MADPKIPFSEPPWLMGLPSPYFSASHRAWQAAIRPFVQAHLHAHAVEWEQAGTVPEHVFSEFAAAHMLIPALPAPLPVAWLKRLGIHTLLGGLPIDEFDALHGYIYGDEMARSGLVGPGASLTTGMAFGVPLILKFGSEELKERLLPDLLTGRKRCCIAITEPDAGSDVAGIVTTAVKSAHGKEWIVNGSKKWWVTLSPTYFSWQSVFECEGRSDRANDGKDNKRHLVRLRQHGRPHRASRKRRKWHLSAGCPPQGPSGSHNAPSKCLGLRLLGHNLH